MSKIIVQMRSGLTLRGEARDVRQLLGRRSPATVAEAHTHDVVGVGYQAVELEVLALARQDTTEDGPRQRFLYLNPGDVVSMQPEAWNVVLEGA